jgi:transcriptional regulator with XRE-family HTH domain
VVGSTTVVRFLYLAPRLPALRQLRLRLALSQRDLALRARISQTALSDLETGKTQARPSTMRKLATALGCEPAALMEPET